MAGAVLRFCGHAGCSAVVSSSRCAVHAVSERRAAESSRLSASRRGYDRRWRRARLAFLSANPLCVRCESDGIVNTATVVDHIKPHRGDRQMFWDSGNWQPLCKGHHDIKTATEDARWG